MFVCVCLKTLSSPSSACQLWNHQNHQQLLERFWCHRWPRMVAERLPYSIIKYQRSRFSRLDPAQAPLKRCREKVSHGRRNSVQHIDQPNKKKDQPIRLIRQLGIETILEEAPLRRTLSNAIRCIYGCSWLTSTAMTVIAPVIYADEGTRPQVTAAVANRIKPTQLLSKPVRYLGFV